MREISQKQTEDPKVERVSFEIKDDLDREIVYHIQTDNFKDLCVVCGLVRLCWVGFGVFFLGSSGLVGGF